MANADPLAAARELTNEIARVESGVRALERSRKEARKSVARAEEALGILEEEREVMRKVLEGVAAERADAAGR